MKGDQRIINLLNQRMISEATGVDQYSAHLALVSIWEYPGLVAYLQERRDDEFRHYNMLRSWIVFLGGTLDTGKVNRVNVGADVPQMHAFDKTVEEVAIADYNVLIDLCIELKDSATRDLIQQILADEIDHLRDLEAQLKQISQMGIQNYLSAKLA